MQQYNLVIPTTILLYIILNCKAATGKLNEQYAHTNQSSKSIGHKRSSNNFVPISTTQRPITRTLKSSLNVEPKNLAQPKHQQQKQSETKDFNLISLNNHESFSPSTLNSFYRYMSKKSEKDRNLPNKQQVEFNQFAIPTQSDIFTQQQMIPNRDSFVNQPSLDDAELNTPLIFASGNNLQVSNPTTQLFSQSQVDPQTNGRAQIENNFYVNDIENQQMLSVPQDLQNNPDMAVNIPSNQHNSQLKDPFSPILLQAQQQQLQQQQQLLQQQQQPPPPPPPDINTLQNYYPNEYESVNQLADLNKQRDYLHALTSNQNQQPGIQTELAHPKMDELTSNLNSNFGQKKEMLTNAQLVSLIDELKAFNSRQAKKLDKAVQSNGKARSQLKEPNHTAQNGIPNDNEKLFTEIVNSLDRSEPQTDEGSQAKVNDADLDSDDDNQKDEDEQKSIDDLNSEDLAKFAKLLIASGNPDSRSSTEVKKSRRHPEESDEEEDIKDALLEPSKQKSPKASSRQKKRPITEAREKKQSEIDSRIDKFISDIAKKSQRMDRRKDRQREDKQKREETDEYSEKARKRRDYSSSFNTKSLMKPQPTENSILNERKSYNNSLADSLDIQMNMEPPTNDKKVLNESFKLGEEEVHKYSNQQNPLQIPVARRSDAYSEPETTTYEKKGTENEEYPKEERNKDHNLLRQGLAKTREAKAKVRSRIPTPVDLLVQKALKGEVDKLVEQNPGLSLQSSKDGSVRLEHNEKVTDEEDNHPGDIDPTKGGSIPAQTEPEPEKETEENVQHDKTVLDEYPISDKVTDRLNKLSRNLDRYFNDGFLKDVENKSQLEPEEKNEKKELNHRPQESVINQRVEKELGHKGSTRPQKDNDFDINVAIDGKRDVPDQDDEDDSSQERDDEALEVKQTKTKKSRKRGDNSMKRGKNHRKMEENRNLIKRSKSLGNRSNSLRKHDIEGAKLKKQLKSLDPVENESLDTPIGPDEDGISPQIGSASGTKGSKESQTNYGKKANTEFYQEPD